uniref:ATP synthase subunit a n=1 Tax=Cornufer vitianus TaxID=1582976 RepID=A0A0K0LFG3_CORVT|nr:ATP synthase F0 subunit 6 [Cornufer vitianus]AIZ97074.1 ATP synthase F0 subunit 6 [Cornufer vitianus]
MMMSIFNQFVLPTILGMPTMPFVIIFPWLLISSLNQWNPNRIHSILNWLLAYLTKQIFLPLSSKISKWSFLFMSILIYLMSVNLLGLLPYTFTPTTQLSLNLALAIPLWITTILIGLRNQFSKSISHLVPEGTPTLLIPALIIIESVSLMIRPLTLAIRLTANLTAGHLLIHLISSGIMVLISTSPILSLLTLIILMLLTILEIAMAVIQAYVFILLLSLYLQENS